MATRAERMRRAAEAYYNSEPRSPFYLREELWEAILTGLEMLSCMFMVFEKPRISRVIENIVSAANQEKLSQAEIICLIRSKLRVVTKELENFENSEDEIVRAKLYGKIEALMELLQELEVNNGEVTSH